MSLTDQAILTELQYHLIEPPDLGATWPSGLWTFVEVVGYLNQRQNRFLKETALLYSQLPIVVTAGSSEIDLPDVWIATARVSWDDGTTISNIPIASVWEADHGYPGWEGTTASRPKLYSDVDADGTLRARLMPPPTADGIVTLLCIALSATLDGAGEIWTVPYEFVPSIKWGVLADMLNKVSRAMDVRAAYCEMRFNEGVEAAKLMLEGWA